MKMLVGATRILPPDNNDNLWCDDSSFVTIDMNNPEGMDRLVLLVIGQKAYHRSFCLKFGVLIWKHQNEQSRSLSSD